MLLCTELYTMKISLLWTQPLSDILHSHRLLATIYLRDN